MKQGRAGQSLSLEWPLVCRLPDGLLQDIRTSKPVRTMRQVLSDCKALAVCSCALLGCCAGKGPRPWCNGNALRVSVHSLCCCVSLCIANPLPCRAVLYPGLRGAEVTTERKAYGIPYHPEVIVWFHRCLPERKDPLDDSMAMTTLIMTIMMIKHLIMMVHDDGHDYFPIGTPELTSLADWPDSRDCGSAAEALGDEAVRDSCAVAQKLMPTACRATALPSEEQGRTLS